MNFDYDVIVMRRVMPDARLLMRPRVLVCLLC